MFQFGAGFLFGNPVGGNLATNPTPKQFGTLQDVSFEITQTLKELRGNLKFPDDVAPGSMKGSGKAMFGRLDIDTFNNMFFAETTPNVVAGIKIMQANEAQTVPGAGPFTVTVTNAANFNTDLNVIYAAGVLAGKRFTKTAGAPTSAGQYSVNPATGVYTFNTADQNVAVLISYSYNSAAQGETITVTNRIMGYGPIVELWLAQPYQGNNGVRLYAVRFAKLGAPLKREDYQIGEMDFEFFANAAGQVIDFFQVTV